MKNEIKKFNLNNKLKLFNYNSDKKILITDRTREDAIYISSLAAYIYNKFFSFNADLLADLNEDHIYTKLYKSFNIKNIFNPSISKFKFLNCNLILHTVFSFFFIILKILFLGKKWFIKHFYYRNVYFGDLIYDGYIVKDFNFKNKSLINLKFLKILLISLYKINYIHSLLKKNNYSLVTCNTHIYNSVSAITMRLALKKKIPVLLLVNNYFKFYNKMSQSYDAHTKVYKNHFQLNKHKYINWKKKINVYLDKRFSGQSSQREAIKAFGEKKLHFSNTLRKNNIVLKNYKRIGFFAPHAFSDSNYHGGIDFLFNDFYDQFRQTIDLIIKEKKIFWFINPHPNSLMYKEENIIQNYVKKLNADNIFVCPIAKFSTIDLIKSSDIILTGRGTVGIEAACLGKKPILAGSSYYSSMDISHNPKDINEYKKLILNTNCNYLLNKNSIEIAKKSFFTHIFKNSHIKSKILPCPSFIDVDLKKKKLLEEHYYKPNFFDKINYNLKKNNIFNDELYIELKKFIIKNKKLIK